MSSDADLWGSQEEDSEYILALVNAPLPSHPQPPAISQVSTGSGGDLKRKRTSSSPTLPVISTSEAYDVDLDQSHVPVEGEDEDNLDLDVDPALFTRQRRHNQERPNAKNESYVYGAAKFGGFGEYMFRKRAKLQFQNQDLTGEGEEAEKKKIFKGIAIYVSFFCLACKGCMELIICVPSLL